MCYILDTELMQFADGLHLKREGKKTIKDNF